MNFSRVMKQDFLAIGVGSILGAIVGVVFFPHLPKAFTIGYPATCFIIMSLILLTVPRVTRIIVNRTRQKLGHPPLPPGA